MSDTCKRLADALRTIPGCPQEMIAVAGYGYYHDYKSPLAMPEVQLVRDLGVLHNMPGLPAESQPLVADLIERVKGGEFDASKAESDEWMRSADGQAAMRQVTGGGR